MDEWQGLVPEEEWREGAACRECSRSRWLAESPINLPNQGSLLKYQRGQVHISQMSSRAPLAIGLWLPFRAGGACTHARRVTWDAAASLVRLASFLRPTAQPLAQLGHQTHPVSPRRSVASSVLLTRGQPARPFGRPPQRCAGRPAWQRVAGQH